MIHGIYLIITIPPLPLLPPAEYAPPPPTMTVSAALSYVPEVSVPRATQFVHDTSEAVAADVHDSAAPEASTPKG